jgi:hypothetical protein
MNKAINFVLKKVGLKKSSKKAKNDRKHLGYTLELSHYLDHDGNFDYSKYRAIQEAGNKRKIDTVWVKEENIKFLSEYILEKLKDPLNGICHGTRRGKEQEWFMKYLAGCKVIGTEISDTAVEFPNTIQWDFHEMKPEWEQYFDFIYSNSFDHSYDPSNCINTWMKCLRDDGVCIIEYTNLHRPEFADELDPFGFELLVFPYLILDWSKGSFAVVDILKGKALPGSAKEIAFLVIRKCR